MRKMDLTDEVLAALAVGARSHRWEIDLLTLDGTPAGRLDGAVSGSLDYSIHKTIRSGGNLSVQRPPGAPEINWNRARLKLWYVLDLPSGDEWAYPLGVFIPEAATDAHNATGSSVDLELYDKLLVLDRDATMTTWSFPKGTHAVTAIRQTLDSALALTDLHLIQDSPDTLATNMTWEPGETKLRIVNDLLEAINYFAIEADGNGVLRSRQYVPPAARSSRWDFADDVSSIYLADFTHDMDAFNVPNRMVVVASTDGEEPALTSMALNEDPDSPYSFQARGRWVTTVDTDVEASSQDVLDRIAARRLTELSQPGSTIEISHALVPFDLNDAVTFTRSGTALLDVPAVVQSFTIQPGDTAGIMSTNLRRVVA